MQLEEGKKMLKNKIPRVLIAATASGEGKTTITCGIIRAFTNRGLKLSSFKCGPDYIDPMFHTKALGVRSRNLDLFMNDENTIKYLLTKNAKNSDISIVEGVMGYYDGLAGKDYRASSYDLAKVTDTPTILIVDCKGKSMSILAQIYGFVNFEKYSNIKAVILNRISPMIYPEIKAMIEERLNIPVLGYMPMLPNNFAFKSRHLGLVTANEIENIDATLNALADEIESTVDLDAIIKLANETSEITCEEIQVKKYEDFKVAVAMDGAFCFYYEDNLELLKEFGAEICYFSPIHDEELPKGISALYLGGGYPELYLEQLSANKTMLKDIKKKIKMGLPCIAECGGFMYLHQSVEDEKNVYHDVVGAVKGKSSYKAKLVRFGYIEMEAQKNTIFGPKGTVLRAHEFHYWDSTNTGDAFLAKKPLRKASWECVLASEKLYAGFPHIHFYNNLKATERFVEICQKYSKNQEQNR